MLNFLTSRKEITIKLTPHSLRLIKNQGLKWLLTANNNLNKRIILIKTLTIIAILSHIHFSKVIEETVWVTDKLYRKPKNKEKGNYFIFISHQIRSLLLPTFFIISCNNYTKI